MEPRIIEDYPIRNMLVSLSIKRTKCEQKSQATNYLILPKNIGSYHPLEESDLSNGELYAIISNKSKKE